MCETQAQQQTATAVEKNRGRLERHTIEKGQTRRSTTYVIISLSRTKANAAFLLKHLRGRWHIENRCFYVLDTVMYVLDTVLGDDASRSRTGHAARALNGIRIATLNLARRLAQTVGSLCRERALNPNLLMDRLRIFKN